MMTTIKNNKIKCTLSSDLAHCSHALPGTQSLLPEDPAACRLAAGEQCASAALMQTILDSDSRDVLDERTTVATLSNLHASGPLLTRQSHSQATLQLPLQESRPVRFNVTNVDDEESI